MSTPLDVWLRAADVLLGSANPAEEDVDVLINAGLEADASRPGDVDPVQLERVIAVLRARSAAMATELADLGRRRAELTRAQLGATQYLS